MSKYAPLQRDLQARTRVDTEVSFAEIEEILGFRLPRSAHEHNAWWSNERETHVQARAWMDAGWQVWRVRRSEGKVYFRPFEASAQLAQTGVSETSAPFVGGESVIVIQKRNLRGAAVRLLEDYCAENGGDTADAIVALLNTMALERRRQLLDWFRANGPTIPGDSTELIREDRDAR
jgi:hypothetical protein